MPGGEQLTGPDVPGPPEVFRISPLTVLAALALAFCATPFALGAPLFWLVYLVPLGIIGWTLWTRTEVDTEAVTVRRVVGRRRVPWAEISSLRLGSADRGLRGSRVSAVLADGTELALPAVHVRDLRRLAAASGGHVPDAADDEPAP